MIWKILVHLLVRDRKSIAIAFFCVLFLKALRNDQDEQWEERRIWATYFRFKPWLGWKLLFQRVGKKRIFSLQFCLWVIYHSNESSKDCTMLYNAPWMRGSVFQSDFQNILWTSHLASCASVSPVIKLHYLQKHGEINWNNTLKMCLVYTKNTNSYVFWEELVWVGKRHLRPLAAVPDS